MRGVPPDPHHYSGDGKDFICLRSRQILPKSYVNDDYCDCSDGTDEPGTAACENGRFHCAQRHMQLGLQNFPSSRVNDYFCDCCDGSDEYKNIRLSRVKCNDTCGNVDDFAKVISTKVATTNALESQPWTELTILNSLVAFILFCCLFLFLRKKCCKNVKTRRHK